MVRGSKRTGHGEYPGRGAAASAITHEAGPDFRQPQDSLPPLRAQARARNDRSLPDLLALPPARGLCRYVACLHRVEKTGAREVDRRL